MGTTGMIVFLYPRRYIGVSSARMLTLTKEFLIAEGGRSRSQVLTESIQDIGTVPDCI